MAIPVFIAYARDDEAFKNALIQHLSVLVDNKTIEHWHDQEIPVGTEWEPQIFARLQTARLIVLLVSSRFLASRYCKEKEMDTALDRHKRGEAVVLPVLVKTCLWDRTRLVDHQILPKDAKPINRWTYEDEAWTSVVAVIEKTALELKREDDKKRQKEAADEAVSQRAQDGLAKLQAQEAIKQAANKKAATEQAIPSELSAGTKAPENKRLEPAQEKPAKPFPWYLSIIIAAALALLVAMLVIAKLASGPPKPNRADTEPSAQTPTSATSPSAQAEDAGAPDAQTFTPSTAKAQDAPPPALADIAPMAFKKVPAGKFLMGSPETEPGRDKDETQHQAEVRAFEMAIHEVSQKQWKSVMGTKAFRCDLSCKDELPANNVSWVDALAFMNKLTKLENKKLPADQQRTSCYTQKNGEWGWNRSCTGYRLPTETEWEYAARAETSTAYSFGDGEKDLCSYGNGAQNNECSDMFKRLAPVGKFQSNLWGLYDMHGNVCEWVWDLYAKYPPETKPGYAGPDKTDEGYRVLRGGSFNKEPSWLRSSIRFKHKSTTQDWEYGFRCVRNAPQLVPSPEPSQ